MERNPRKKDYVDPWLNVCGCCPLDDCVRGEGQMQPRNANYRNERIKECPMYIAHNKGWDGHEAWENRKELELLRMIKN